MLRIILLLLFCSTLCFQALAQVDRVKTHYQQLDKTKDNATLSFVRPSMGLIDDAEQLQQIVLLRHGEPALKKKGCFNRKEAARFIMDYDSVGVYPLHFRPMAIQEGEVNVIYTSNLNRAKHTARLAFGDSITYEEDTLFREFERKIIAFPNIKMPLKFWLLNSRLLWLLGANKKGIESFKRAKQRTGKVADQLAGYATEEKRVILVAHGFLIRQTIKTLKKQGWHLVRKGGSDYLAASLLIRQEKP